MEAYGQVEVRGGREVPKWIEGDTARTNSSWWRRLARRIVYSALIDKYELVAHRELSHWHPNADIAVLVGYPCSHLPTAARQLAQRGIPYVVDIGDPWILTNPQPEGGWLRRHRAERLERKLWSGAAGAIVTTSGQGLALERLFPHLRVLVRPNGFYLVDATPPPKRPSSNPSELRLLHCGSLYGERADFIAVLKRLAESGKWERIVLRQYGPDWEGLLTPLESIIEIQHRRAVTWQQVLAQAKRFDLALVIGWRDPARMPSKAVQYLTLPMPRIAIASSNAEDSLRHYADRQPGWLVLDGAEADPASALTRHLDRAWVCDELMPPAGESWEEVEKVLAAFVAGLVTS